MMFEVTRKGRAMQIDFAFLADSATVRPDGRIDAVAIGAFAVTATQFPAAVERFAVVTRVGFAADETESGTLHVRVRAPDGTVVAERTTTVAPPHPLTQPQPQGRARTRVVNFFNVTLPAPGAYHPVVSLAGEDYIGMHFDASLITPPTHQPG